MAAVPFLLIRGWGSATWFISGLQLFAGKQFTVVNDDAKMSKVDIEKLIYSHGGNIVQVAQYAIA